MKQPTKDGGELSDVSSVVLRISPRGMLDLPLQARLILGFEKGKRKVLRILVRSDCVVLGGTETNEGVRVHASPRGLMRLPTAARSAIGGEALVSKCLLSMTQREVRLHSL